MSESRNRQGWDAPPPQGPAAQRGMRWPWVVLVVALLLAGGCVGAVGLVVSEVSDEVWLTAKVRYEVTGDAKNVTVAYSVWTDGDIVMDQETATSLPWRKEVEAEGRGRSGTVVVTLGAGGGRATCSVSVDDGTPRTATASGAFATAACIAS
ncbi:hypothetical protein [Streptomyces sp. NPDC002187]|uniref:hypothetical protein n=1 Tax=Streptomyces sp. NPDC002187 TaxID=3364637 RepID=UPI0036ACF4CA